MSINLHKGLSNSAVVKMMEQQAWDELRPGVYRRRLELRFTDHAGATSGHHTLTLEECRFECQRCGTEINIVNDGPMLLDELWLKLFPNNGVACTRCIEHELGRPLTATDLRPGVVINDVFLTRRARAHVEHHGAADYADQSELNC